MQKKHRIPVSLSFVIFLYFAISTIFIDYIEIAFGLMYWVELICGFAATGLVFYLFRKYFIVKNNFDKADLFFLIFLLIFMIITIVFPDRSFDTVNYHLYNQMEPFADKVNNDFFPSSFIQSFSYAYPDRIFYIFRYILGYRLGVVLNYLLVILLYYQVKNILKTTFQIKTITVNIFATIITLTLSIIDIIDSYYVDLMSLVMLMEIFQVVFYGVMLTADHKTNRMVISWLGLLSGITFAIKISNMFFVLALAVFYIVINFKNFKYIHLDGYILFFVLFCTPCVLYVIDTFIQTGNPVFPFYNSLFKSPYYPLSNWSDQRFGPKTFLQTIFWPIYIVFHPGKAYELAMLEPMWGIGYAFSWIYVSYSIFCKLKKRKTHQRKLVFAILCIMLNLTWAKFVLGFVRYGLFVLVLNNIFVFVMLYDVFRNRKIFLTTLIIVTLTYNYGYCCVMYVTHGGYWSYNNCFAYSSKTYLYNAKRLFGRGDIQVELPENSAWGIAHSNSGIMKLINGQIPMVYLQDSGLNSVDNKRDTILNQYEHIFITFDLTEFDSATKDLKNAGYEIESVYDIIKPDFINADNLIYVFEIKKAKDKSAIQILTPEEYNREFNYVP